MNELNDFLKLMAEAKKKDPLAIKSKEIKQNIKEDLGGFFSQMSAIKAEDPNIQKNKKLQKEIHENLQSDLGSLFSELVELKKKKIELIEENPQLAVKEIKEEVINEVMPLPTPVGLVSPEQQLEPNSATEIDITAVSKYLTDIQPKDSTLPSEYDLINKKIKFLEQWIGKIQNAGPGSGEVNLRYLDDVKRDTIADGRWLKYSEADKKFVFDEINPYEVVYNTTLVTTPTYTVQDSDWYIGVNRAGPVTITMPASPSSGRVLVIKDESGNASVNPITVLGTVDNDSGGFILQMDNGGIQMVYRAGWRVI
jgi:hypothetical protein